MRRETIALLERLTSPGPKRILSLDGGGIRGAISLGFLEKIEQFLRIRHQKADLKLCDYFDLIGGTSTGAIIASALAIGMDAGEIKKMYLGLGERVFGRKKWKKWVALFSAEPLKKELETVLGDRTLGDSSIKTGLCVVTKRADTRSTWPIINHPNGKYYGHNSPMLLRDVVRASTAAPAYFVPEKVDVGKGEYGAFVDGGVSMANNPSLQLFLVATLSGFPFHWKTGEDQLLLVSVGTGLWRQRDDVKKVMNSKLWNWAAEVPSMLIEDANWSNQLLLQYFSNTPTAWEIDREIGDLSKDLLTPVPLLSYLRYNAWLEESYLQGLGLAKLKEKLKSLRDMSDAGSRFDHAEIGERAAARQVKDEHFPKAFDLKS